MREIQAYRPNTPRRRARVKYGQGRRAECPQVFDSTRRRRGAPRAKLPVCSGMPPICWSERKALPRPRDVDAARVTFGTGFLKLSMASWQTGACSTIRTESARGLSNLALSNLADGVPTFCSQSSRPFPHRAFASGLPMDLNISACTSAASSFSAQSSRPGASTRKLIALAV